MTGTGTDFARKGPLAIGSAHEAAEWISQALVDYRDGGPDLEAECIALARRFGLAQDEVRTSWADAKEERARANHARPINVKEDWARIAAEADEAEAKREAKAAANFAAHRAKMQARWSQQAAEERATAKAQETEEAQEAPKQEAAETRDEEAGSEFMRAATAKVREKFADAPKTEGAELGSAVHVAFAEDEPDEGLDPAVTSVEEFVNRSF